MSSNRNQLDRVRDILDAIRSIERHLIGYDLPRFLTDDTVRKATRYDLMVIGVAAKHLLPVVESRYPDIPWRKIRGLRDVIAHAYFRIDDEAIWITTTDSLPPLKSAMLAEKAYLESITPSP